MLKSENGRNKQHVLATCKPISMAANRTSMRWHDGILSVELRRLMEYLYITTR